MKKLILTIIISTAMYMNATAADAVGGKPKPVIEKLDLTAEQAKRMRAAHMRYVKEVSKILTKKQLERWKKIRADHREEHHPERKTVKPQNRPGLRQPKGK